MEIPILEIQFPNGLTERYAIDFVTREKFSLETGMIKYASVEEDILDHVSKRDIGNLRKDYPNWKELTFNNEEYRDKVWEIFEKKAEQLDSEYHILKKISIEGESASEIFKVYQNGSFGDFVSIWARSAFDDRIERWEEKCLFAIAARRIGKEATLGYVNFSEDKKKCSIDHFALKKALMVNKEKE